MVSSTKYILAGGKLFCPIARLRIVVVSGVLDTALEAALGRGTMDATIVRYGVQEA